MKTSFCILTLLGMSVLNAGTPADPVRVLAAAPLRFEPAADGHAHFVARGARFRFAFRGTQADFLAVDHNVSLRFQGANAKAALEGVDKMRSVTNDFHGNDPAKWRKGVANFGRLQARDVYPGIDLVYYGNAGELEYDLTVKPGADPRQIRLRLDGARARVDSEGNLVADVIQKRPVAYQIGADGSRIPVESRYRRNADGSYGFRLGAYDRGRELVIDPTVTLGVYFSGSNQDTGTAIGHDTIGFIYVGGSTFSNDIALAGNSQQGTAGGGSDVFLAKIDPNAAPGTQIVYTSFFGGSADDILGGMTVGPNGDVYMTGTTLSANFPVVNGAQTTPGSLRDAFVAWFDPSQNLAYSTYLGGGADDFGFAVTFDSKGLIYATGATSSDNFPTTASYRTQRAGSQDAFVAVIDPSQAGSATLAYSSYLGGSGWETGRGIAVAGDGTFWVVGGTYSFDFPLFGASYQPFYRGSGDGFVAQFNPALGANSLIYTTYFGGTDVEEARDVLIDGKGRVVLSGFTVSTDLPTTPNAMQLLYGGNTDVFVAILDPKAAGSAQLAYGTYFGGTDADVEFDMKQDSAGNLYLAGMTLSAGLAVTPNAVQAAYDQSMDAFALKFNPAQPGPLAISFLTYLGSDGLQLANGIDFDAKGNIYLVGVTSGPIFDAFGGPGKASSPGKQDAFVIGMSTAR
jgi:beta-propeller repeat-containing protein